MSDGEHSYDAELLQDRPSSRGCHVPPRFASDVREELPRLVLRVIGSLLGLRVTRTLALWKKAYKKAKVEMAWVLTLTGAAYKRVFLFQFFPRAEQENLKRDRADGTAEEQAKELSVGVLHKSIVGPCQCIHVIRMLLRWRPCCTHFGNPCDGGSHRSHGQSDDRQKNDRQGSDRQGGGGNYRNNNNNNYSHDNRNSGMDVDKGTEVSILRVYQLWFPSSPGYPQQAGHLQRWTDRKRTLVLADGFSEFQEVFPENFWEGIPLIRVVEFNIELIPELRQSPRLLYRMAPD
ncbi:hypothetical protein Tco_0345871 [Tanacetum coccineum]